MAVKDFKNETNFPAFVCNAKGKMWKLESPKMPNTVKEKLILGTDTYPTETGTVLYIWID